MKLGAVPKGFIRRYKTIDIGDIQVEAVALLENYLPASFMESAEGAGAELEQVSLNGKDLLPRLNSSWIERIEIIFEQAYADGEFENED